MANKEVGLNHVDYQFENVSDSTITKSESSDDEINLFTKGKQKKSKKSRKGQKSAWKNSTMNDLVDSICSNEYAKKVLFLLTIKHQIMQKFIR